MSTLGGRRRSRTPGAPAAGRSSGETTGQVSDELPDDAPPPLTTRLLAVVSAIGPPLTIGTALLYYFGWARSNAQADAMGLDVSLFGYTAQDYVIRSINTLFVPLVCILVASLLWIALDRRLRGWIDARNDRRVPAARVAAAGIALGIVVAIATPVLAPPQSQLAIFTPYIVAVGVLVAAWGVRLRRRVHPGDHQPLTTGQRAVESGIVLSLVTLLLFWGSADFAGALGRGLALSYEQGVASLPRSELYSPEKLTIGAPNVTEEQVGTVDAPVYRYSGLRLLVLSGGRFFFLHDGWTLRDGRVVVIPDDNTVRMEFGN